MAAQIFAFQLRRSQGVDWMQEELAELYRIEHALVQSGLSVEHDRGQTDEGDPWFVFCRPDGEVLIHLTRFDGLYRLHSPALPAPLVGRTFGELTKAFADQMPLQVVVPRNRGARLYVHPASLLALIVGTIFLAAQDVLPPEGSPEASKTGGDGEAVAAHPLKSVLQAAFQSHFDSVLGWLRDGGSAQQSIAWTVISTLTAVLTGLTDALTHDSPAAASEAQQTAQVGDAQQLSDHSAPINNDAPGSHDSADLSTNMAALHLDEGGPVKASGAESDVPQDQAAIAQLPVKSAASSSASDPDPGVAISGKAPEAVKVFDHLGVASDAPAQDQTWAHLALAMAPKSSPDTTSPGSASLSPNSSSNSSGGSVVVNDLLTSLSSANLPTSSQSSFSDITNLLAHATSVDFSKTDWAFLVHPVALNGTLDSSSPSVLPVSAAKPFDAQAAATLETFLQANPNAQAAFDEHNIVIYDTKSGTHTSDNVLNVWTFADGSTITIVGTADQHHTTLV